MRVEVKLFRSSWKNKQDQYFEQIKPSQILMAFQTQPRVTFPIKWPSENDFIANS